MLFGFLDGGVERSHYERRPFFEGFDVVETSVLPVFFGLLGKDTVLIVDDWTEGVMLTGKIFEVLGDPEEGLPGCFELRLVSFKINSAGCSAHLYLPSVVGMFRRLRMHLRG